jgi:phosphoribosylanthranilate isomerase
MLTQIYEVSTSEEARAISEIGIDHIGVLVGNGEFPRELSLEAARAVAAGILPGSKFAALFLTADVGLIETWARELKPPLSTWVLHPNCSARMTPRPSRRSCPACSS